MIQPVIDQALHHLQADGVLDRGLLAAALHAAKLHIQTQALVLEDASRYRKLRGQVRHTFATAKGTHFCGEIDITFPPPGAIYVYQDVTAAFDRAVDDHEVKL